MTEVMVMRIGEIAQATGVSTRALRYYEEHGLLDSERSAGGQRHYRPDAVDRVRWIQALYAAGVPSPGIERLLPCLHTGHVTPDMIDQLVLQRERVEARVTELTTTRDRLDELIAAVRAHTAAPCDEPAG